MSELIEPAKTTSHKALRNDELIHDRRKWKPRYELTGRVNLSPATLISWCVQQPEVPIQARENAGYIIAHVVRHRMFGEPTSVYVAGAQPPPFLTTSFMAPDALSTAIEHSRRLLRLSNDFDGEGSPEYTEEVWTRAVEFIRRTANELLHSFGIHLEAPSIGAGPDGSIDVHWRTQLFELLVNFPSNADEAVRFYGDDFGEQKIKGTLDTRRFNRGLLLLLGMSR